MSWLTDEILADVVVSITWIGVLAYAVFGGADFGSGVWDLLAGRSGSGAQARKQIDRSIGPVWEANHVWLIFVLVFLWTGFPTVFAATVTALFIPLIFVALGIVLRGASFVFRKSSSTFSQAKFFGILFAASSLITPFFFGASVGALASGRVTVAGEADAWTVWLNPTSILGGVLAVGTCAWMAAVFLASDSAAAGLDDLAATFSRRAQITGVVLGAISLVGIVILENDAPTLADGLEKAAAPLVIISAAGGIGAMWLLRIERFASARVPAVIAVVAIVLGWGVGQYPWMLVDDITIVNAAADRAVLWGLVGAFILAAVLVIPSLIWLFRLTDSGALSGDGQRSDSSQALLDAAQERERAESLEG